MTKTEKGQAAIQPVVEMSDKEKKRRKDRREEDIKGLNAKIANIEADLSRKPDRLNRKELEDRLEELKGWRDHLQYLNKHDIFTHRTPTRRPNGDADRSRYHGLW